MEHVLALQIIPNQMRWTRWVRAWQPCWRHALGTGVAWGAVSRPASIWGRDLGTPNLQSKN
ncbi:MAG: hypothetical protein CMN05_11935 [Roseibacillus sp.]|nr:hypothetical protein [Roseibacillus sp.]